MSEVPRHEFVPRQYLNEAYSDHPLPIGHGQTISPACSGVTNARCSLIRALLEQPLESRVPPKRGEGGIDPDPIARHVIGREGE